jgi:LmbE family N-acetylglucosaminyl deacetylase
VTGILPRALGALSLLLAVPGAAPAQDDRTLLAVFAHADDEFLVMPLLARYAREGADVHLAIVTRGEKWAPEMELSPGDEIATVRAAESRCAAQALGIHPPIQFSFDDGGLGQRVTPPWTTLAAVEEQLGALFARLQPDVVITFGPDGGYGHTEHRLVGAVVTTLMQKEVEGAPEHLLYVGIPDELLPDPLPPGSLPYQATPMKYLTVQVPFTAEDGEAVAKAFACYKSQFPAEVLQAGPMMAHYVFWQGKVYLRPWFGVVRGGDVFALEAAGPE